MQLNVSTNITMIKNRIRTQHHNGQKQFNVRQIPLERLRTMFYCPVTHSRARFRPLEKTLSQVNHFTRINTPTRIVFKKLFPYRNRMK